MIIPSDLDTVYFKLSNVHYVLNENEVHKCNKFSHQKIGKKFVSHSTNINTAFLKLCHSTLKSVATHTIMVIYSQNFDKHVKHKKQVFIEKLP